MIIGESAARDYMSAFTDYPENTTPWMKSISQTKMLLFFPMPILVIVRPYRLWNVL